jgi:hypothetical protein
VTIAEPIFAAVVMESRSQAVPQLPESATFSIRRATYRLGSAGRRRTSRAELYTRGVAGV